MNYSSRSNWTVALAGLMLCLIGQSFLAAQTQLSPLQPADTSSPRATLNSFIAACNEFDRIARETQNATDVSSLILPASARVLDCLDLSGLPADLKDSSGISSAAFLKEVLDRVELPDDREIPFDAEAQESLVSKWRITGTRLTIELKTEGPRAGAYLFSQETVKNAAKSYSLCREMPYRDNGRQTSPGIYSRLAAITKKQPKLSVDTSSPRGTFTLFLNSANEVYEVIKTHEFVDRTDPAFAPLTNRILSCLDQSQIPEYSREWYASEAAVCLKEVLDRMPLPSVEEIPGAEDVDASEKGEGVLHWQVPNSRITIAKVTEGPRKGQFLFSSETVAAAPGLYAKMSGQPYRTDGRPTSPDLHTWYLNSPAHPYLGRLVSRSSNWVRSQIYKLAVWQWLGLLLFAAIAMALLILGLWLGQVRGAVWRGRNLVRYWTTLLYPLLSLFVPYVFMNLIENFLTIRSNVLYYVQFGANATFLFVSLVLILNVTARVGDSALALFGNRIGVLDAHLTRLVCRIFGFVVATIVFLEGGRYLGFPFATLLASAGIGGLAIALSAQGMVRGLFGTVTVLFDKPYRVGDRIVARGFDGFVEEIGIRSTKLRAFQTGHIISIPNDQMADTEIENIGRRKHIRRIANIKLPLDTPRDKVEIAVEKMRAILAGKEGMDPEWPPRVYFADIESEAFSIQMVYWFAPPDLWDFCKFNEQVNFELFKVFEEQGIQFSLPQRHSFWRHDDQQGPLDVQLIPGQSS